MSNATPTFRYVFEHIALRDLIISNRDFILNVFKIGPNTMTGFLRGLLIDFKNRNMDLREKDINLEESDFEVTLSILSNEQKLLLIKTPNPLEATETFYTGVLVGEELRYFTLELGYDIVENKIYYVVCEWDKENKHYNYGKISEPKPGLFAGLIEKIVCK